MGGKTGSHRPGKPLRRVVTSLVVTLLVAVSLAGCAAGYARYMGKSLSRMQNRDWAGALEKLEKPAKSDRTGKKEEAPEPDTKPDGTESDVDGASVGGGEPASPESLEEKPASDG